MVIFFRNRYDAGAFIMQTNGRTRRQFGVWSFLNSRNELTSYSLCRACCRRIFARASRALVRPSLWRLTDDNCASRLLSTTHHAKSATLIHHIAMVHEKMQVFYIIPLCQKYIQVIFKNINRHYILS